MSFIVSNNEGEGEGIARGFYVEKAIAAAQSQFFAAAFSSTTREGLSQEMHLDDVDPEVFSQLIYWLENHKIKDEELVARYQKQEIEQLEQQDDDFDNRDQECDDFDPFTEDMDEKQWEKIFGKDDDIALSQLPDVVLLAKLCILADRFLMPELHARCLSLLEPLIFIFGPMSAPVQELASFIFATDVSPDIQSMIVDLCIVHSQGHDLVNTKFWYKKASYKFIVEYILALGRLYVSSIGVAAAIKYLGEILERRKLFESKKKMSDQWVPPGLVMMGWRDLKSREEVGIKFPPEPAEQVRGILESWLAGELRHHDLHSHTTGDMMDGLCNSLNNHTLLDVNEMTNALDPDSDIMDAYQDFLVEFATQLRGLLLVVRPKPRGLDIIVSLSLKDHLKAEK